MLTILVVEDEKGIRQNLVTVLRLEGYKVLEAENGRLGLALAQQNLPALILSDVMMPELDGYGMLEALRADPRTAGIPLIFLTARTDRTDMRMGMNLGANDYISKPFTIDEVLGAISARLRHTRSTESSDAAERAIASREDAQRMSQHDMKTPLGSLIAAPALLRAGRVMSEAEEAVLGMMEAAAKRALGMVNLSLALYQMESGSYAFSPSPVDLSHLIVEVTRDLAVHAQSKQVDFATLGNVSAVHVDAEELLCYSIVSNLLKNALEAAPAGSTVNVHVNAGPQVSVRIHNQGAIPISLRDKFFSKYATAGKAGGTGLGAYSAHLLAKVQGGSLAMQSSDEDGTTLILTLRQSVDAPAPTAPAVALTRASEPTSDKPMDGPRAYVLLVDDDPFSRLIMQDLLSQLDVDVDVAINGRSACESVLNRRPEVIIMDLEMPVMDGVEAMRHIHAFQAQAAQTPSLMVAYSGNDDASTRARCLALGFSRCLDKPGQLASLVSLFDALGVRV